MLKKCMQLYGAKSFKNIYKTSKGVIIKKCLRIIICTIERIIL